MAVPNMIVTLVANTTKYAKGLRDAAGRTKTFGTVAVTAFRTAAGAAVGLGIALLRAIPTLANMGAESRKADIQLKFMLENMEGIGVETNKTVARMAEYAKQVSKATGIDDEQVKAVQRKLLVFKSVRSTADEMGGAFDRATDAAIDLAAAGFGDMETNAVKLGRMLENPLKNLDAMNRAGIVFTDTEQRKIEKLVKSGKLLEAQDLILESIETRVGGLAEAAATPFERMMQQFNDMGDTIGEALLGPLEDMNTEISKWIATPEAKKDLQDIVDGFVIIATAIGDAAKFMKDVKTTLDDITKNNKWFFDGLRLWVDATFPNANTFNSGNPSAPGGPRPIAPTRTPITVNFNTPIDSVSAGREIARVLSDYDRARGR
jgi:ribosomal protein S13